MCQQIPLPQFVHCCTGLSAMGRSSTSVQVRYSNLLGSVNIEADFRAYYGQNGQNVNQYYWDYGVGVLQKNRIIKLVFIEVHCGAKGEEVLEKFYWLQTILNAYNLKGYQCEYYFVPTGSAPSTKNSNYVKLITRGIKIKKKVVI